MNNIMIDLETLGTEPGCIVLSIGAVKFDLQTGEVGEHFYCVIDRAESMCIGLTTNAETMKWWEKQSEEARQVLNHNVGVSPRIAVKRFADWLPEDAIIWGNGAAFDNVILEAVYRKVGVPAPWKFWNSLCYRTIKTIAPMLGADAPLFRVGTHHNALDDAITQARHMCDLWLKLKNAI